MQRVALGYRGRALQASSLALAICLSTSPAFARDKVSTEIVVEATLDDPSSETGVTAKSLDAVEITASAPISVVENLSLFPGVVAFEKGGAGGGTYLSIRGGEPNFAQVVINGVRVDDPLNSSGGGFDFSLLEPSVVGELQLISGPQSTIYGADALSGVVSIETGRSSDQGNGGLHAGYGSGGSYELGGHLAVAGGAGEISIAAGYSDSDELLAGSSNRRFNALLSAAPDLGSDFALDLFGMIATSESEGFPEDSGGPDLSVLRVLEERDRRQLAFGGTFAAALTSTLTAQVRAGYARSDFDANSPGIAPGNLDGVPPIITDSRFERFETVTSLAFEANDWLTVQTGASFIDETGTSIGEIDFGFPIPTEFSISRDMPGVFATVVAESDEGFSFFAGLRADWPEGGSVRWTPRVGARAPIADTGAVLFANYARGFKRPSLFALGYPLIANPDLEDERSETADIGIEYASNEPGWSGSIAVFQSVYRNLIDFDPQLFTNVNRNRVTVEGVEASLAKTTGSVTARAALTYQSARSADGAQLRFRPDWTGRVSLRWQMASQLTLSAHGEFSSSFTDSSVPTGFVRNSGYEILSLDAEWMVSDGITLFGTVRNLTDADFYRTVGFPEPGRNVFVGLRTGF